MSSAHGNIAKASRPSDDGWLRGRHRGALAICALLIAYASLYPFVPLRPPPSDALALFFNPRYLSAFDIALNALAYVPLGALACLVFRRPGEDTPAIAMALAFGTAFSFAMELFQLFVPFRVASVVDVASNAFGTLVGTLLFVQPIHELATRPLGRLRERLVIPGPWGDAGLVLVVLWLLAQLNPALPFFEAGNISEAGGAGTPEVTGTMIALQAISVAFSVAGFGLFISVLLQGPAGTLRTTLLLLTVALWLKFAAAAIMLRPHVTLDWANTGRVAGIAAGVLLLVPLRRFSRPARIYSSILLVLAGALFTKILGAYSPLDDLLRLFNWPHGQLTTFATLTRYLHESWPAAALAFLIAMFIWNRADPVR